MNPFEARVLRDQAAAKTMERLRSDHERASHRIRPLVGHIQRNLFEPDLNYEQIREALSIRDNNRTTLFRRELGLTPAAYVRDCRMEVACRLLRETDMEVSWIAEIVGYGGPQVFTPAFKRYAGVTPTWYRRRERPNGEIPTVTAGPIPDLDPSAWRRFVVGELESEEAAVFLHLFLDRYPEVRRRLLYEVRRRLLCELLLRLIRLLQGDGPLCADVDVLAGEPPEVGEVGALVATDETETDELPATERAAVLWRLARNFRASAENTVLGRDYVRMLEDLAERREFESDDLLRAAKGRPGDRQAPGAAALLAADEPLEEPDAFTLAAVVQAVEVGPLGPDWQRRDAARALAWLIRQSPAALAKVRELLAEVEGPPRKGCLLDVARGLAGAPRRRRRSRRRKAQGRAASGSRGPFANAGV